MSNLCPHCRQPMPDTHGLIVDDDRREIRFNGVVVADLTGKQFQMFKILYERIGRVVRKESFMDEIYGLLTDEEEPDDKIVDVWICKIRPRIEPLGLEIKTHWGGGFELLPPVRRGEEAA